MANEEWNPTTSEKLEEAIAWVSFFGEALGKPKIIDGTLYLTSGDENSMAGMPVRPSQGCGRLKGLASVRVTLPEAVVCMREIHQLLGEIQQEAGLPPRE